MMISFFRSIKYAILDLFRNVWLSLVTITVIVMALFAVNTFLVLNVLGSIAVNSVESKIDVSVFFYPNAQDSKIFALKSKILSIPEVNEAEYVSPDDAVDIFRQEHKDDQEILAALDEVEENPFGASLVIRAQSPRDYEKVLDILNSAEFTDIIFDKNFDDNQVVIERITSISDKVKSIGLVLSVIFGFVALIVVFNTIRVSMYTHRDEITIMKLVGASNTFIRMPYLIQGFVFSVIAMLLLFAIFYPLIHIIQPYADVFFGDATIDLFAYFNKNFVTLFGTQFIFVLLLNVVSSFIATSKQ